MLFDWRRALLIYILCELGYLSQNICRKDIIPFDISINFSQMSTVLSTVITKEKSLFFSLNSRNWIKGVNWISSQFINVEARLENANFFLSFRDLYYVQTKLILCDTIMWI